MMFVSSSKCALCTLLVQLLLVFTFSFQLHSPIYARVKREVNIHKLSAEEGVKTELDKAEKALEDALSELPSEAELLAKERALAEKAIAAEEASAAPLLEMFQSLPCPPFDIRVPGEQGDATLVTDPAWQSVLLTFKFLGFPVNIESSANFLPQDRPSCAMGNEVFEDPNQLLSVLCERYVLSDFVESATPILEVIEPLYPSFVRFVTNSDVTINKQLKKDLQSNLYFLDKRVQRSRGEFIESDEVTTGDLVLAHQLHHMKVALKNLKNFEFSKELSALNSYMETLFDMEIVQTTMISEEAIIKKYEDLRTSNQGQ